MAQSPLFSTGARFLHWTMAIMIVTMLFVGIGMVASNGRYHSLVEIHRPLGAAILVLVSIRLIYRLLNPPPPLPASMPGVIRVTAHLSHYALYALMFAVPLVGWGMLSAGGYPAVLYGALRLPALLPREPALYATLRHAHTVLALALFGVFLAHLGAALAHVLIFRDGVFQSMASLRGGRIRPAR